MGGTESAQAQPRPRAGAAACRAPAPPRPRLSPLLGGILAVLLLTSPGHAEVTVSTSLDRNQVAVGQAATLTVEIQGSQNAPAPALSAPDGITLRYLGPSTQVSFVNGQMSASVSHRYTVIPSREGTFTLGPFTVEVGGRSYEQAALRLQALPAARAAQAQPGRDQVQIAVTVPRNRVYLQEPLPVTVTLLVGNVRVEDLQYPTLAADGFTLERFAEPKQTREVRDGRAVAVLRFDTTLTPLRPGILNLGPARAQMSIVVPRRGGRSDPFFGGLFGDYQKEPIEVTSEAVPLEVLALPEEGRPAEFRGAIGRFTLDATANPTEVRVGDPVTVRMTIGGEGNLAKIAAPAIDPAGDFKAYPAQEVSGAPGQKVFEQVLIPLRPEVEAIPAIRFSFFDTESGRYDTLTAGPFPLTVGAAAQAQQPRIVQGDAASADAAPREEKLGRDLVYIKDAPGALTARGERFLTRTWFWLALALPALAYLALWLWVRQRDRLRLDPRYARFARAGREATAALGAARQLLDQGQRFDDALSRTLRDYLAAKLDLPPGAVEVENVARRLADDGGAPDTAQRIERVLELLERTRYAPGAASRAEREEALRLGEEIVAALEKRRYRGAAAAAAAILLLVAAAGSAPAQEPPPSGAPATAFYEGNSLYGRGEFEAAARAYESALAAGVESPALYFNLGNAYMRSGKPGRAILNYERARRLAPADADIATNASFALEDRGIAVETPLWQRLAFPLGERTSSVALALLFAAVYIALMAALAVRLWWPVAHRAAGRVAVVAAVVLAFAGANLGYRAWRYDLADDVVVVHSGDTAVRFEPSEEGTTHFSVPEGTLLHVLESRDGWLQVARADGRRGWIQAGACERL